MKIYTKQITEVMYVSDNGREQPLKSMPKTYLINALLKAERDGATDIVEVLKTEVFRRMPAETEAEQTEREKQG